MFKNEREKKVKQKRTEQEASNKLKQVFAFAKKTQTQADYKPNNRKRDIIYTFLAKMHI